MAIEYGHITKRDRQGQDIVDGAGMPVQVWGFINTKTGEIFKTKQEALRKSQNDRLRNKGFHQPEDTASQLARAAKQPRRYRQK
jgi:hypothetical protein